MFDLEYVCCNSHNNGFYCKFYSLGQLAAVAGIDRSDFQPPGRPQFYSSTMEPTVGVAGLLSGGDHQTVGTMTDASALVRELKAVLREHTAMTNMFLWTNVGIRKPGPP